MTERLLEGVSVSGLPDWDQGRSQRIRFIDFDHPERNDFLAINQFRVDEPGGQAKKFVVPDVVLFVNGIPLVVIECKSPYVTDPMAEGINQLRRYANQRGLGAPEGNEQLFWTNQFVVSTYGDKARVGTFTAGPEHFLEWKDAAPLSRDELASQLGKPAAELTGQELLVAGMLTPANLLDIVRHFTLFTEAERQADQDRRSLPAVPRGSPGAAPTADRQDPRCGRRERPPRRPDLAHPRLGQVPDHGVPGPRDALGPGAAGLQGRRRHRPDRPGEAAVGDRQALRRGCPAGPARQQAQAVLAEHGPALVFAMIQKYRDTDAAGTSETRLAGDETQRGARRSQYR